MRFFVKKAFEAKGYKELNDSSEAQIKNLNKEVDNLNKIILRDSVQIAASEKLLKEKDKTSTILKKQADEYKSERDRESRWRKFWKGLSGILGILGGTYIVYDQLKL